MFARFKAYLFRPGDNTSPQPLVEQKTQEKLPAEPEIKPTTTQKPSTQPVPLDKQINEQTRNYLSGYAIQSVWNRENKINEPTPDEPPIIQIIKHSLFITQTLSTLYAAFYTAEGTEEKKSGSPEVKTPKETDKKDASTTPENNNILEELIKDLNLEGNETVKQISTEVTKSITEYKQETSEDLQTSSLTQTISGGTTYLLNRLGMRTFYSAAKGSLTTASYASYLPALLRIWSRIQKIMNIAAKADISPTNEYKSVLEVIKQFSKKPGSAEIEQFKDKYFTAMPQALYEFIISFTGIIRPSSPINLEAKYSEPITYELIISDHKPNSQDIQPNTYYLLKEGPDSNWELYFYYIEETNQKLKLEKIALTDVPQLPAILKDKIDIAEINHLKSIITTNVNNRWNPNIQERREWFPLIDVTQNTVLSVKVVSDLLNQCAINVTETHGELDPQRQAFIDKTRAALNGKIDDDGYYIYSSEEKETTLSQSLKGVFNLFWAINEACRGLWENPGFSANVQMGIHGLKVWENYWKINWPALGGDLNKFSSQVIDALLVFGIDVTFHRLNGIAAHLHNVEKRYYLKYGALSQHLCPYFDYIEDIFYERGLGIPGNPFGYTEEQKIALKSKCQNSATPAIETKEKKESSYENEWHKEALVQLDKMRKDSVLRRFKRYGLIDYIRASRQSKENANINVIQQKRKLTMLLAHMGHVDDLIKPEDSKENSDYLAKAHEIANTFANDSQAIHNLISDVYKVDSGLGHALAIEAYIAGYLTILKPQWLENIDEKTIRQDLSNILDRLPIEDVINQFTSTSSDSNRLKRPNAFLSILDGRLPSKEIKSKGLTPKKNFIDALIKALIRSHNKHAQYPEVQTKIGLFLGRLAHSSPKIATAVFLNPQAKEILRTTCLNSLAPQTALYYETLVKTFQIKHTSQGYELENRNYQQFLRENSTIVAEIYRISTQNMRKSPEPADTKATSTKETKSFSPAKNQDSQIIDECIQDPFKFAELTNNFIKTCLSPGSEAEKIMRKFFTAFILCPNNNKVRIKILERYAATEGSKHTAFIDLITNRASKRFWDLAKSTLSSHTYVATCFRELHEKNITLHMSFKEEKKVSDSNSRSPQNELKERSSRIIRLEQKKIQKLASDLKPQKIDLSLHCKRFQHEISYSKQQLNNHLDTLKKKTDKIAGSAHQKHEAKIPNESNINTEIIYLKDKLKLIIDILNRYKEDRDSFLVTLGRPIKPLRYQKQKLMLKYLDKFERYQEALNNIDNEFKTPIDKRLELERIIKKIYGAGKKLEEEHTTITQSNEHKGNLEVKISGIRSIIDSKSSIQDINEDIAVSHAIKSDIDTVTKIINTIKRALKTAFSHYMPGLFSQENKSKHESKSPLSTKHSCSFSPSQR